MIRALGRHAPRIHPQAFIHDAAEIIGRVTVGPRASVWPFTVLRGDVNRIVVGARTNVQDLCVIHVRERFPVVLGRGITVGHRVVLHGCRIGDGCLIGMGAVVMESTVGPRSLVAAGALVLAGMRIPPRSLVMGSPARVVRRLSGREVAQLRGGALSYLKLARLHRETSRPIVPW